MSTGKIQLSTGQAIEYKAYVRRFDFSGGGVLYLLASCAYPVGGYRIFFEAEYGGTSFKLMEEVPQIVNQLVTYYVASWTSSQPLVDPPAEVTITDASGTRTVAVEPWTINVAAAEPELA